MANTSTPRGLIPYRHFDGSVWNGSGNIYSIPAGYGTAIYIGDPVKCISTQADANGIPGINLASAGSGNVLCGVFMGIIPGGNPVVAVTRDLNIYHPASTLQYCLVADDPTLLFWVQDDGTGSTLNQWPGQNANLVSGSGSNTTGYSGWQLGGSTVDASTANKQVKILRLLDTPDAAANAQPPTANAKWLVKINQHQYANGIVGA